MSKNEIYFPYLGCHLLKYIIRNICDITYIDHEAVMIYIHQLKSFLCISCLYQCLDDYLERSGVHFLTYALFRKCHLSKTILALVSLIPLPRCSTCNLRSTQSTSPGWQSVPEHTRSEALSYFCVLCTVPPNQPLSPHVLIMTKVVHFLFKKTLKYCCYCYQKQHFVVPPYVSEYLRSLVITFISFHRRRSLGRC